MKITPVPHGVEIIGPSEGRSPGIHVSELYGAFYQEMDPKRYRSGGEMPHVKMAMGLAWETYLEKRLLASGINAIRPDEQMVQLVTGPMAFSPDLFIVNGHDTGGEIKLTFMSESDALDEPKFAKWHTQMMCYGHLLELNRWRMYALFVNGDYKKQREPVLRAYDIEYTAREMREEWQTMVNHATHKGLLK